MLARFKIPKTLLWVANLMVIFFVIFTIFRLVAFFVFKDRMNISFSFGEVLPCFVDFNHAVAYCTDQYAPAMVTFFFRQE
jgi:hypothetical protein